MAIKLLVHPTHSRVKRGCFSGGCRHISLCATGATTVIVNVDSAACAPEVIISH